VRVCVAARSVPKRRGDQALAANLLDTAMATARPHRMSLGELERGRDGVIVSIADRATRVRITESEQDGHGFRRSKCEIEAGHPMRLAQPCPSRWVTAGEHCPQRLRCDLAIEAKQTITAGDPSAGCFPADVVILDTLSDSIEVVPLLPVSELPHTQHGRTPRLSTLCRTAGTMVQIRDLKSGSSLRRESELIRASRSCRQEGRAVRVDEMSSSRRDAGLWMGREH
jgi:hypothetical protein